MISAEEEGEEDHKLKPGTSWGQGSVVPYDLPSGVLRSTLFSYDLPSRNLRATYFTKEVSFCIFFIWFLEGFALRSTSIFKGFALWSAYPPLLQKYLLWKKGCPLMIYLFWEGFALWSTFMFLLRLFAYDLPSRFVCLVVFYCPVFHHFIFLVFFSLCLLVLTWLCWLNLTTWLSETDNS